MERIERIEHKLFLKKHPNLHGIMEKSGFTLDEVRLMPRGGAPGEGAPAHDAYFEVRYSSPPAGGREEFTQRDIASVSTRLREILAEHGEVIRHDFVGDRSGALLRLVLHVKPKR